MWEFQKESICREIQKVYSKWKEKSILDVLKISWIEVSVWDKLNALSNRNNPEYFFTDPHWNNIIVRSLTIATKCSNDITSEQQQQVRDWIVWFFSRKPQPSWNILWRIMTQDVFHQFFTWSLNQKNYFDDDIYSVLSFCIKQSWWTKHDTIHILSAYNFQQTRKIPNWINLLDKFISKEFLFSLFDNDMDLFIIILPLYRSKPYCNEALLAAAKRYPNDILKDIPKWIDLSWFQSIFDTCLKWAWLRQNIIVWTLLQLKNYQESFKNINQLKVNMNKLISKLTPKSIEELRNDHFPFP